MNTTKSPTTRERILEASLRLFNEKGYAATTLTEIAAAVAISQGNLTYHFPTKYDLAAQLKDQAHKRMLARRANYQSGTLADDYIEQLLFAMELTWNHRFLLRDKLQFEEGSEGGISNREFLENLEELHHLLDRVNKAGYFRKDLPINLTTLASSLWIVTRYWMDHLREMEDCIEVTWADQKRGLDHHLAILLPSLTATARRQFEAAALRAINEERTHSQIA